MKGSFAFLFQEGAVWIAASSGTMWEYLHIFGREECSGSWCRLLGTGATARRYRDLHVDLLYWL